MRTTRPDSAGCASTWLAAGAIALLLAGCGGGASTQVGGPPNLNGPLIGGSVSMPNGRVAAAPSAL